MERIVYADHSATTYVKKDVLNEMIPYFTENFGNPSSLYTMARINKEALENSRAKIASLIGAKSSEIYFTSSGCESDNWAIKGVAEALKHKGNHIITTKIEHPAVLNSCKHLEKLGFEVSYVDVDEYGTVKLDEIKKSIKDTTILISVMFANNEIGTIQPIKEIGCIAKEHNIYFHTDAVQAMSYLNIDVRELNIDLLTMSGHKFYGPKGVGALYIRTGVKIANLIDGGSQERGKRAATENIASIVGMAKALELAYENQDETNKKLSYLRDELQKKILSEIDYVKVNGNELNRLPGVLNVSIQFIEGESLLMMLDMQGICASTGSACSSGSLDPSHVLLAIGLPHEMAHGSLRFSFGEVNTIDDVNYIVEKLKVIVEKLRLMSPLYEDVERGKTNDVQ